MRPGFALRVTTTMAVSARLALLALLHVLYSLSALCFELKVPSRLIKQVHVHQAGFAGLWLNISRLLPFLPLGFHGQAPGLVRRDRGWSQRV